VCVRMNMRESGGEASTLGKNPSQAHSPIGVRALVGHERALVPVTESFSESFTSARKMHTSARKLGTGMHKSPVGFTSARNTYHERS
jgi:hypothetical protein